MKKKILSVDDREPLNLEAKQFLKKYGDVLAVAAAIIRSRLGRGERATLHDAAEATSHLTPGMPMWRMKAMLSTAVHLGAMAGWDIAVARGVGFQIKHTERGKKAA